MTKWLASVQSYDEAKMLLPSLPDILDMKDPSKGALGALSVDIVADIVTLVDGQCLTSATVGDLKMEAQLIGKAITTMAQSNVDYVKIGLFPDKALPDCIEELKQTIKSLKTPVIAVLFADKNYNIDLIPLLKLAGFQGIMIDTATKKGQNLLDHWDSDLLTHFVTSVHQQKMLCGLAGALQIKDIHTLKQYHPDYLGFRSALCTQSRTSPLQLELAKQVQQTVTSSI